MVGGQRPLSGGRLSRNCCLRLRPLVAVETQGSDGIQEKCRGRGCAGGSRGGGEWGGQLDLITACPYFIAYTTLGCEEKNKKQIVSRLPEGGRPTLSRRLATLIRSPLPKDPGVFPIIPLIKADNEECGSVALCFRCHSCTIPSSSGFFFSPAPAWRDESDSWHMLEISVITPCGQTALLVHSSFPLELPFWSSRRSPGGAERPVKSAGRARRAATMETGC